MFKCKILIFIVIFFCISGISFGQGATKVGIGIAIVDMGKLFETDNGLGTFATITVPIITSSGFRIEPEVGYFSLAQDYELIGLSIEASVSTWRIGIGILPQKMYEDFTLYYGARIGYISQKLKIENQGFKKNKTTAGFFIAPAIGGEHNFSNHFSIGAEAQVVYNSLKNEEDYRDYDVDISSFDLRGLVFVRFYF